MNKLFHYFLCPSSRFIRIILNEKKVDFNLFIEDFSNPSEDYLFKNPGGFFPTLNTSSNENIVGSLVIVEYLQNLMLPPIFMIKENDFFIDDNLSYVDLYYGASLTVLDYIDELTFFDYEKLKNLYSIIKSRPSFKKILADRIVGVNPHSNYLKLDY